MYISIFKTNVILFPKKVYLFFSYLFMKRFSLLVFIGTIICSTLLFYFREEELPVEKIVTYVSKLQQPDGSFYGDIYGEVDTRFSFCAVACLSLLVRWAGLFLELFYFSCLLLLIFTRRCFNCFITMADPHLHTSTINKKKIYLNIKILER